jgi:hypothetical protein
MKTKLVVVTEQAIQDEIAAWATETDEIMAAVSYVGRDGYEFFPEKNRPSRMYFLVDMSPQTVKCGLTNPEGVSRLLHLGSARSLPGLHSKFIVFGDTAALVGSTNLSTSSLAQYQCGLLTDQPKAVKELRKRFRFLWTKGTEITVSECKKAQKLFTKHQSGTPSASGKRKARLKHWRAPILEPSEFSVGLTEAEVHRIRAKYEKEKCPYWPEQTHKANANRRVRNLREHSNELSQLVKRGRWTKEDREELFNLAFIDGAAAQIGKPEFLRQPRSKVVAAMRYLFDSASDASDYIRFEQVASATGRYRLKRLGPSGVAMLMHLWKPKEHAIWNDSVETGLRSLKVRFNRARSRNLGQAYMDRTAALKSMMRTFRFGSLAETDHLVDAFGKGHIKL